MADGVTIAPTPVERKKRSLAFGHFKKTRMCSYGAECSYGENCFFAHSPEELVTPLSLAKTSLCKAYLDGVCFLPPDDCPFAHGRRELRRVVSEKSQRRKNKSRQGSDEESVQSVQSGDGSPDSHGGRGGSDFNLGPDPSQSTEYESKEADTPPPSTWGTPPLSVQGSPPASMQGSPPASMRDAVVPPPPVSSGSMGSTAQHPTLMMSSFVRNVGSAQLPAFMWQGQVYLGNVQDILQKVEPDHYED